MDLFSDMPGMGAMTPLAERMRPQRLVDVYGQKHLLGEGKLLRKLIEGDAVRSLILWGPPSTGKTTLAQVMANSTMSHFEKFSAAIHGAKDLRAIIDRAIQRRSSGGKTALFVDEIHRLRSDVTDILLPQVEMGNLVLIGATTQNPSFSVGPALLSRCQVFMLEPLGSSDVLDGLKKALSHPQGLKGCEVEGGSLEIMAEGCGGDMRFALNALEMVCLANQGEVVTCEMIREVMGSYSAKYSRSDDRFALLSALQKSIRDSDADASLLYLAAMIDAGEDCLVIARRLVVMAAEECGVADPMAQQVAVSCYQACEKVGYPECSINLGMTVSYLATAEKSNRSYVGLKSAMSAIQAKGGVTVPLHLRNAPTGMMKDLGFKEGYQYTHEEEFGVSSMNCLPEEFAGMVFYRPTSTGNEFNVLERMEARAKIKKEKQNGR